MHVRTTPPEPDAQSVKLSLDRNVSPGGSVFFASREEASGWPLVERLFGVPGVHSVLLRENLVLVARQDGVAWEELLPAVKQALETFLEEHGEAAAGVDEAELRRRVEEVLEKEINPAVAMHGGFIRLVAVEGTRVYLEMGGGCQGCGMAAMTLRQGVEQAIRVRVPEVTEILDRTDHAAGEHPYY